MMMAATNVMRMWVGTILLLAGILVQGESWQLPLVADTGFFERENALVSASVDFPIPVGSCRGSLSSQGEDAADIPFWFEVSGAAAGVLSWVLDGEVDSLLQVPFMLHIEPADTALWACGSESVRTSVLASRNIIPNAGFEVLTTDPPAASSTWQGKRTPDGWRLIDYPYRHRQLPDLKSSCRISEAKVHGGERSLRFESEVNSDTAVCPTANGPVFDLRPGTRYELSYYLLIESVTQGGYVSASVNFLDADGKRLYPRNYALNRIQCAYGTTRNLENDYAGKWVHVSVVKESLPEAAQGQLVVGTSLVGVFFVDDFRLREVENGPPVTVKIGTWEKEDR